MAESITLEKCLECGHSGLDCAQMTFGYGAELLGFDKTTAEKIAAAFGGGMFNGDTCGAVCGSLMALGLKYGHFDPVDPDTKKEMMAITKEFEEAFIEENGSLICRELLGYSFGDPEEMQTIIQKGLMDKICPGVIVSACEILEDML